MRRVSTATPISRHASLIFAESILTGSRRFVVVRGEERWTKVLIWTVCFLFCAYQTVKFLGIFHQYPVSLSIRQEFPDSVMIPAMTLCTGNSIARDKYCRHHVGHCDEEMNVKQEYRDVEGKGTRQQYEKYRINFDKILIGSTCSGVSNCFNISNSLYLPLLDKKGRRTICNVLNHQFYGPDAKNAAVMRVKSDSVFKEITTLNILAWMQLLELQVSPEYRPSMIAFHSPFFLVNPFLEDGIKTKLGAGLLLNLRVTEVIRLPAPYATDCTDYIEEWKKRKSGPVSKEMCIQECIYKEILSRCGCFLIGILYDSREKFCEKEDMACVEQVDDSICQEKCKKDCLTIKYIYYTNYISGETVKDVLFNALDYFPDLDALINATDMRQIQGIAMLYKGREKIVYFYTPKYQTAQLFGIIGGYLAVWLGLSVFEIADFVGVIMKIAALYYQRKIKPHFAMFCLQQE